MMNTFNSLRPSITLSALAISALLTAPALASDKLDRQRLIEAAQSIGQPSAEFDAFNEMLDADESNVTQAPLATQSRPAPSSEPSTSESVTPLPQAGQVPQASSDTPLPGGKPALGVLDEQTIRNRLALYGKQTLTINHGQSKQLSEAATHLLSTLPDIHPQADVSPAIVDIPAAADVSSVLQDNATLSNAPSHAVSLGLSAEVKQGGLEPNERPTTNPKAKLKQARQAIDKLFPKASIKQATDER